MTIAQVAVQHVPTPDPFTAARAAKTEHRLRELLDRDIGQMPSMCLVVGDDGTEVPLPRDAVRILVDVLGVLGRGNRVTISQLPDRVHHRPNRERIWEPIGLEY